MSSIRHNDVQLARDVIVSNVYLQPANDRPSV